MANNMTGRNTAANMNYKKPNNIHFFIVIGSNSLVGKGLHFLQLQILVLIACITLL